MEALWDLVRGFQRANDDAKGDLLAEALRAEHEVFFERDKPKDRQTLRAAYAGQVERWLILRDSGTTVVPDFSPAVVTFHWAIEFPEVFTRLNGGFDTFVGNPPFAGKNTLSNSTSSSPRLRLG